MVVTQYGSEKKRGSLMVVGSGIKCVGQITLEAKGWIEQADHVLYLATDPATESWINQAKKDNTNLSLEYKVGRTSEQVHEAIVEKIMEKVREGQDVCAVFYGHPGVLAGASGEAIKRARKAGYRAAMLPGISSVDCLMADLEVDLQVDLVAGGCQIFSALNFMEMGHSLDIHCHVVFMKIATLGGPTFYSRSPDGHAFPELAKKLIGLYGATHEVVLYQAAKYPTCPPLICHLPLKNLEALVREDTSCALTLYIPPRSRAATAAAKTALRKAKDAYERAQAAHKDAPAMDAAMTALNEAKTALNAAKTGLDSAKTAYEGAHHSAPATDAAKTALNDAKVAFDAGQIALDAAQAAYDAAPAAQEAQVANDAAQNALDAAKTGLDSAKTAYEDALAKYAVEPDRVAAKTALNDAKTVLNDAKGWYEAALVAQKDAQSAHRDAQVAYEAALAKYEAAQAGYNKWASATFGEEGYQPSSYGSQLAGHLAELSQNPRQMAALNRARNALAVPQATLSEKPWLEGDVNSILQEYGRLLTPPELDALLNPTNRASNLYQAMQEPSPKKAAGSYTPQTNLQNPVTTQGELQAAIPYIDPSGYQALAQVVDGSAIKWIPK